MSSLSVNRLYSADRSARRACSREPPQLRKVCDSHIREHRNEQYLLFKVKALYAFRFSEGLHLHVYMSPVFAAEFIFNQFVVLIT